MTGIPPDTSPLEDGDPLTQASRLHPGITTGFLGVPPTVENAPPNGSIPGPPSQVMPVGHTNDPRTKPQSGPAGPM